MNRAIRNPVRYSPESSLAIRQRAGQQTQARNAAIEFVLKHPNAAKNEVQRQLTLWRKADPKKWAGSVAVQRPGLLRGRETIRQLHPLAGQAHGAENTPRKPGTPQGEAQWT